MTLLEITQPLRRALGALRRRIRSLLLLLGVSRTVVFVIGALLVFFVADYSLRLPLWVRAVFLFAFLAGTAAVLVRRLLGPLSARLDDQMLAERVEAAHPEFEDRLRSSLAFAHAPENPDNEDSPELMEVVAHETVDLARSVSFTGVAKSRIPARWALGAGLLLLATATSAVARSDLASTFALRSLLLKDIAWPRRTTLTVVGMKPGLPRKVTRGRETTVQVRAEGSVPDRVEFRFWERDAKERSVERVELTPSAEDPALFAITLPVYSTYEFTVRGGDDDRELSYLIEALTPPSILSIEMDCTYPVYLERPPETRRGGDQRVPEGTKVRLRVRSNMPVAQASISIGADEARPLEREAPDRHAIDLAADKDLRYSIRLVGGNREENDPGVDTFVLRVAKDQAPTVRIHTPAARTERLPSGVLFVGFAARDDHRVTSVKLRYQVNDDVERVVALGESGGDAIRMLQAPALTGAQVLGLAVLDLKRLRKDDAALVDRGDVIAYRIEAGDSARHTARARSDYRVDLVSEEDLAQTIQGRQQELRESVRRAEDQASQAADKLVAAGEVAEGDTEFRRAVGRVQAAQARVIDDLDAIARRVHGILNVYVFNRIDDESGVNQILPYYERHLLDPELRGSVPFTGPLYRALRTAHVEREIRAGTAYTKLIEMADLADRLAVDHGPEAYKALTQLNAARTAPEAEAATRAVAAEQKAIRDGLARLGELMREWENFDSVVRFFKGLRDTEKSVVEDLGNLPK